MALCKDSINIRWVNGCLRSRSPLWWVSLEPGLWVLWKHGSAQLGFCLRSNGRWANARARGTPRYPSSDTVEECKCPRPGDIRQTTVPLTQGLEQNGSMPTLSSRMAGEQDAAPAVRDWVVNQKSGHPLRLRSQCLCGSCQS